MNILKHLDALLVTNPTNVRYLTGFVGAAPGEREAYVLLTPNQTFLFTNALYLEQAKKLPVTVVEVSRENPFAKKLAEILKRSQTLKRVRLGLEKHDLTVAEYHKIILEHKNVMLVPTQGRIEKLRMIKRDDEIENINAAAKITDQCFDFVLEKIYPGVTEEKIAWEMEAFIRKKGARLAFSPIVAFGKNTSQPHYNPNFTRPRLEIEARQGEALKSQDIILLDLGAKVNGYGSDMTRMVFVGKPKEEWKRAYETVRDAQQVALEYLQMSHPARQGETFQARSGTVVDRIARDIIQKAGFPAYPHSLGHGVGLDIHEAPRLTIKKDAVLKPGMVVTIEPAIYKEGSYGIRIEDLVVLKKNGVEILSQSQKEMIIL